MVLIIPSKSKQFLNGFLTNLNTRPFYPLPYVKTLIYSSRNRHLLMKHMPKYKNREQYACCHHTRICYREYTEKLLPVHA